ncbi:hypothetical protein ABBQ32_002942 [Trebouxia sp. C0010 RCD-2024]
MTFCLNRFQHEHETCANTCSSCYGADNHSKLASARRAGAHKAAVSQFGQVKLHFKTDSLKKVTLSHSSGRSRPSGQQVKEVDESESPCPVVPALIKPKRKSPPCKLSLRLSSTGLRHELLETMQLYQVSPIDATAASEDLMCPENQSVSLPHATDFSAAGVIAISFWPPDGHIRILMTQECGRKSKWHKKLVRANLYNKAKPFGILGGKRQKVEDDPRVTALREVSEETAGLLSAENVDLPHSAILLGAPANYCAFLYKLEGQNDLPETFSKMLADPDSNLAQSCTTKALAWVPVRDLARLPRGHFFDKLMRQSIIPAWLCAQQREHDQQALQAGLFIVDDSDAAAA